MAARGAAEGKPGCWRKSEDHCEEKEKRRAMDVGEGSRMPQRTHAGREGERRVGKTGGVAAERSQRELTETQRWGPQRLRKATQRMSQQSASDACVGVAARAAELEAAVLEPVVALIEGHTPQAVAVGSLAEREAQGKRRVEQMWEREREKAGVGGWGWRWG